MPSPPCACTSVPPVFPTPGSPAPPPPVGRWLLPPAPPGFPYAVTPGTISTEPPVNVVKEPLEL